MYRGNFKSPQKILKFIVAILKRSVFGVYLFNSHAQTIALISYRAEDRNILNPFIEETIKEWALIDGAFVIDGDGAVHFLP